MTKQSPYRYQAGTLFDKLDNGFHRHDYGQVCNVSKNKARDGWGIFLGSGDARHYTKVCSNGKRSWDH